MVCDLLSQTIVVPSLLQEALSRKKVWIQTRGFQRVISKTSYHSGIIQSSQSSSWPCGLGYANLARNLGQFVSHGEQGVAAFAVVEFTVLAP